MSNLCRSPNFYVDPTTTQIIETGSRTYPYRTIKPVFVELLNHHAHSDRNFTIYLKENKEVYLEEDVNYILNITSVAFNTFADDSTSTPGRATLKLTTAEQPGISAKAAFHILVNTDLRLDQKLAEGSFSDLEILRLMSPFVSIRVVRGSISFTNINLESDFTSSSDGKYPTFLILLDTFIFLINLQEHMFKIGK